MENLILIGAGGHAKSVIECINPRKYKVCGFIDEKKVGFHMSYKILGKHFKDMIDYKSYSYFVSIGDISARHYWFKELLSHKLKIINVIDSTAIVADNVTMGIGNFIGKMSIINSDCVIGNNNIINNKALIEHECTIGDNNHISTNSTINGNVILGNNIFFGSSAVCIGQRSIGSESIIGAGSVIIKDVPDKVTVVGVPGHIVKEDLK